MTALKKVVPNIKKEKAKNLAEMIDRLPTPALSNDASYSCLNAKLLKVFFAPSISFGSRYGLV